MWNYGIIQYWIGLTRIRDNSAEDQCHSELQFIIKNANCLLLLTLKSATFCQNIYSVIKIGAKHVYNFSRLFAGQTIRGGILL
jgi:hypothetical protein